MQSPMPRSVVLVCLLAGSAYADSGTLPNGATITFDTLWLHEHNSVDPQLPDCLEESARGGGVLMGLRHRTLPAEGVQFHPESVLTQEGKHLLANFLGEV